MIDVHFALNHCADHFAGIAAASVQLENNAAIGVVFHCSLVNKIQKRLVRVLASCLEKAKYDRKCFAPRPPKPSTQENQTCRFLLVSVVALATRWGSGPPLYTAYALQGP